MHECDRCGEQYYTWDPILVMGFFLCGRCQEAVRTFIQMGKINL